MTFNEKCVLLENIFLKERGNEMKNSNGKNTVYSLVVVFNDGTQHNFIIDKKSAKFFSVSLFKKLFLNKISNAKDCFVVKGKI